ncbi:alpha/beta hydrolase [Micromonospora sp. NPDC047707]|uniref:alpha/beta fold hydrolase n=1 Tax=Micromonospora sp. NPDC047707 TaxID=3154498 RepID=UPI003456C131
MDNIEAAHRFIDLSRGRMHAAMTGDGNSVILLHGWPGYWIDYRYVLPLAAGRAQLIAPDFFGFGLSDHLDGDPIRSADEEAFAHDVVEMINALELTDVIIVGHDIGSAVAPVVARLKPDRVRGLVLLNPTHPYIGNKRYMPETQREAWYQHFHQLALAEHLLDGKEGEIYNYLSHFYDHWAGKDKIMPEHIDAIARTYGRPGAFTSSIAWYRARAVRREQSPPPPLNVPTLALWGDRDPMRPLSHKENFELAFPLSVSVILPGVGHFVPLEAPNAVVDAIDRLIHA